MKALPFDGAYATRLPDAEPTVWRNRPPGPMKYPVPDARYEKARYDGVTRDVAVLPGHRHRGKMSAGTFPASP